ncbi:MAG: DUF5678 domain-containing protein [Deltaproteobacteria bacterium]|nr:DUF5678 domain-containing protein [Deltaproteobacteria bacterium]
MLDNILVKNAELYDGKYVATKSFLDKEVVCYGDDIVKVYNAAKEAGIEAPVVFYIPERDLIHIY